MTRRNPGGPTAGYDYGHRFLIQGHEVFTPSGATYNRAYFTRVNLDVSDPAHRVTLLNPLPADATDSGVRSIDGSTYDPFTGQLLFTAEAGNAGGVFGQPLKWSVDDRPGRRQLRRLDGQGRLRGHPQRQARQPHHHRGHRRRERHTPTASSSQTRSSTASSRRTPAT